jgi:hypothetical protein
MFDRVPLGSFCCGDNCAEPPERVRSFIWISQQTVVALLSLSPERFDPLPNGSVEIADLFVGFKSPDFFGLKHGRHGDLYSTQAA